jgi:hypothetical protein
MDKNCRRALKSTFDSRSSILNAAQSSFHRALSAEHSPAIHVNYFPRYMRGQIRREEQD